MKNYLASLLLLPTLAAAQVPAAYPYLVRGRVGHLQAPAKVYLVNGPQVLDSAAVRDGRFELRGTVPLPTSAALVLERQGRLRDGWQEKMLSGKLCKVFVESPDRAHLFLEPGPVVVTTADSLRHARVAGGPQTTAYQRLEAASDLFTARFRAAHSRAESDTLQKQYADMRLAFVQANPTAWVSLEALQQLRMWRPPTYAEVAPLYAAFSPEMRTSPSGKQYGIILSGLQATAIGAAAPVFTQATPEGRAVSLADYRGRYVLVDFWASWCTPCRAENPTILKAYEAFKGRNFEVLGVSLDAEKTRSAWVRAIADDQMPWTQVSDLHGFESAVAQQYGIMSIPQNFLIDPSGKIIASNLHGDELQSTLARLLK